MHATTELAASHGVLWKKALALGAPKTKGCQAQERRRAAAKLAKENVQRQLSAIGDAEIGRRVREIKQEKRAEAVLWRAEQQQRQALRPVGNLLGATSMTQAKQLHEVKQQDEEELRRVEAQISFLMGGACAPGKPPAERAATGGGGGPAGSSTWDQHVASEAARLAKSRLLADAARREAIPQRPDKWWLGGCICWVNDAYGEDWAKYGEGVLVYFRGLRWLAILFFAMAIVATPAIGLNVVTNPEAKAGCPTDGVRVCTLFTMYGNLPGANATSTFGSTSTALRYSYLIRSFVDAMYTLIFMAGASWIARKQAALITKQRTDNITPADFTLLVTGLPHDASAVEIKRFCEGVAASQQAKAQRQLAQKMGLGKLHLPQAEPVILDVNVVDYQHGGLLPALARRTDLHRVYVKEEARARKKLEKKHAETAAAADEEEGCAGTTQSLSLAEEHRAMLEQSKAFAVAQTKLLDCDQEIEKIEKARAQKSRRNISAFVTFGEWEHCRNVEAAFAGLWGGYLFVPVDFRWRSTHRLRTQRALEPSDLQWHNFATSSMSLAMRRLISVLVVLAVLGISGSALLWTSRFRERTIALDGDVCSSVVCDTLHQQVLMGGNDTASSGSSSYEATTPVDHILREQFRLPCGHAATEVHFRDNLMAMQLESMLLVEASGDLDQKANVRGCESSTDYCTETLDLKTVLSSEKQLCSKAIALQRLHMGLAWLPMVIALLTNCVLRALIPALVRFEHYSSHSGEELSAFMRAFGAHFTCLGFLVFGASSPSISNSGAVQTMVYLGSQMLGAGIHLAPLESPAVEFEPQWYKDVGVGLCALLVIHSIFVKCEVLLFDLVLPLFNRQCCTHHADQTQAELHKRYAPHKFRLAPRYAQICTLIFCTLVFCSAMPILLWVTACDLALWYCMDVLLFYRVYQKPPQYTARIAKCVGRLLPYAAAVHLAISCWVYSAAFVETEFYGTGELESFLASVQSRSAEKGFNIQNDTVTRLTDRWASVTSNAGPFGERLVGRIVVLPVFILLMLCLYTFLHRRVWTALWTICRMIVTQARQHICIPSGKAAAAAKSAAVGQPRHRPRYLQSIDEMCKHHRLATYDIAGHPLYAAAFAGTTAIDAPPNELSYRNPALMKAISQHLRRSDSTKEYNRSKKAAQ